MSRAQRFEACVLPYLDAGYNLARWLLRDVRAAEDAVQEASLRALRYLDALRGDDARAWWLGIVRNTCFTMLEQARRGGEVLEFDEATYAAELAETPRADPADRAQQAQLKRRVDAALRALSPALREVVVLRELEELSYEQIALVVGVPLGTVMSRLSRARARLRERLVDDPVGR